MAKKPKAEGGHKIRSVNSGASIDASFYPQPDMGKAPESKGASTSGALEHFLHGK